MAKTRKTWREKLEKAPPPKVVDDPRGRGRMLIPTGLDVDALVRSIPVGKLVTADQLRERLARGFGADITCPLVTGIFLRIIAEAAEEGLGRGAKLITPYWRVVRVDGSLIDKFPGGVEAQAKRLIAEGHTILAGASRKPPRVKDLKEPLLSV